MSFKVQYRPCREVAFEPLSELYSFPGGLANPAVACEALLLLVFAVDMALSFRTAFLAGEAVVSHFVGHL